LFPQLDMIGTLGYNSSSPNFNGYLDQFKNRDNLFWSAGGQMTFPLGNGTARNNLKAAKAAKDQATLGLKQLEQNVMVTIENDIATANTRFQQVTATREARVYAEAALEAEQKKLESGKSTSFVVLQLTRDLTSARSAEISALANYNISLSQLALDEGTTLERRHVTLQWK
jgi:outer membrane protein